MSDVLLALQLATLGMSKRAISKATGGSRTGSESCPRTRIGDSGEPWTISVARRKDVHYLDSFIGPKR